MPYKDRMPQRASNGTAMINNSHSWAGRRGKMDHDDIRSFAEPEVANHLELRNCSCFRGDISRGCCCAISLVGRWRCVVSLRGHVCGPGGLASTATQKPADEDRRVAGAKRQAAHRK